jgi:Terpene synthase family 2, C-terminal metal binding
VLSANAHWSYRVVPALDHYLLQREYDSAVHTCIDLVELAGGFFIPDHVHAAEPLPTMRRLCARALAYPNDLMSYEKEVLRHGNPNNLVHVLMTSRSLPFDGAVHDAVALINRYTRGLIALGTADPALWARRRHPGRALCGGHAAAPAEQLRLVAGDRPLPHEGVALPGAAARGRRASRLRPVGGRPGQRLDPGPPAAVGGAGRAEVGGGLHWRDGRSGSLSAPDLTASCGRSGGEPRS